MLKWSLIILAACLALVALIAVIGLFLPKGHVASSRAKFRQPPQSIWDVITDFAAAPSWRADLQRVEKAPQQQHGRPVWVEVGKDGRIPIAVEVLDPPRRMVTRIADDKLPFGGTWTYEIAPAGDGGATLTITEDGEIRNPIFRFAARLFFGYHGTLERYLHALGAKFGEEVTIKRLQ